MNTRAFYSVLIVVAVLGALAAWWLFPERLRSEMGFQEKRQSAPPTVFASGTSNIPSGDLEAMRTGLEAWAGNIQKGGATIVPPPVKQIQAAVASGDNEAILRAFHGVVYSHYKTDEVVQALKEFLNDPNPFVRYKAAEALFIVGDRAGYSTLLSLVQSDDPIEGIGSDVRIQSAQTLAKFREATAAQAIYELYRRDPNSGLLPELLLLGFNVTSIYEARGFSPSVIQGYAKGNVVSFIPQIKLVYEQASKPQTKVAAAWALASMTGSQNATNYLVDQAQTLLANSKMLDGTKEGSAKYAAGADAIKYLGTIQTPSARRTLEAALESKDVQIARIAAVNLIFNQGGSNKVNQMVVSELNGKETVIGVELALNLSVKLGNNPDIQAAGQKFAQQSGSRLWELYTVERKNWPIYNWIDNYVVSLNGT